MRNVLLGFACLFALPLAAQNSGQVLDADVLWKVTRDSVGNDSVVQEAFEQLIAATNGPENIEVQLARCRFFTDRNRLIEALEVVQALQQLPEHELDSKLQITLQILQGAIKGPLGDHPAAQQHYHEAIRLQDSLGLHDSTYEAHLGLIAMFIKQAQPNEALSMLKTILADSSSMVPGAFQECCFRLSNAYYNLQKQDLATRFRDRSIALADTSNRKSMNLKGQALVAQAQVQFISGEHDDAVASCKQALAIAQQTQSLELLSRSYSGLGTTYGAMGKRDLQEATFLELLKAAEASGDVEMLYIAKNNLSSCYFSQGRFEESVYQMVDANKLFVQRINEKNQASMTRTAMEFSFEAERKQKAQEIERAQLNLKAETAQNRLLLGGLIAAALLILLVVIGYRRISVARKETALKNEQLRKLDRMNKEIFGIISHDLRDPLLSLGLLADSVGSTELSVVQAQQFASELKNHVGQTNQVLENLLNWARTELGVDFSATQRADASAIASVVISHLSKASIKKEIEIVNELAANSHVALNADILQIVLRNLLTNALKYSHPGEEIFIGATSNGGLYVRDTGVGIAAEKLAKLGNQTVLSDLGTSNETGFGLGLYITFALLRKSGWDMVVTSTPNRGTTFKFAPS